MKKLSVIYFVFLAATAGFFSSCNNDDENPAPSVGFVDSDGTATADAGDSVEVSFVANNNGGANLDELSVTVDGNNYGGFNAGIPLSISGESYQSTVMLAAPSADSRQYVFTVVDNDGITGTNTFTVTAEQNVAVSSHDNVTLGAQNNASGSFFGLANGTVYSQQQAENNPSVVDITFAQIGSPETQPMLISPDYREEMGLSVNVGNNVTLHETTNIDFDDVTADDLLGISINSSAAAKSVVISEGSTYEFVAEGGEKGLIRINSINEGSGLNGSVNFDVVFVQ